MCTYNIIESYDYLCTYSTNSCHIYVKDDFL